MKMLLVRRAIWGIVLTLAASAAFAQAQTQAQSGPPQGATSNALEEVVVTAQFRNESVQTTPLAITAVSAEAIAARGQTSIIEITQDAPSVALSSETGAFGPSMSAFIRGVGQADLDPALEPGVGIYVDDVYFGTLTGSIFDLLDLDRVEVLRGPQGTLEGMNSEGGAVKLFSKKPDANESMNLSLLLGSRNHVELRASTNFAISDNLFVRLSGVGNHQDGYVTRYDFGCANPSFTATDINGVTGTYSVAPGFLAQTSNCVLGHEGGIGYAGGRLAVRWLATDSLEFNLTGDLSNTNQEHPAETLGYAGPGPLSTPVANPSQANVYAPALGIPTTNGHLLPFDFAAVPALQPPSFYSNYQNFCLPAPPANAIAPPFLAGVLGTNSGQGPFCVDPRVTIQSWGAELTTDYKINDSMSLKNIVADRSYESTWVHDNDVSVWDGDLGAESMGHHQFSEELRLNGNWNNFLDYTVGGYYFRELTVYFGHEDLWYVVSSFPGIFNFYQNDPVLAHDKAGFLHTTFHLTPQLDAIFGARYTSQDKTYNYVRLNPQGTTGGSATLVSLLNGASSHYSATRWDWRADLDYKFSSAAMLYGQFSTGFKGGGVDPRPFYVQQAVQFAPETLTTYELGLKSNWFDNHLHANIDAYFSQYRDIQLTLANCSQVPSIAAATAAANANLPPGAPPVNYGSPCALPYNAGTAHQKGVEFESQARFGGLQIDANFGYLKFNYVSLDPNAGIPLSDITPYTSEWTGGGGIQYTAVFGTHGSLTARLDATTRSGYFTGAQNSAYNATGGYTVYNAHLTWEPPKSNWQAILQVKNLTDKRYVYGDFDLVGAGQGTQVLTPAPPIELDLQIKHQM